MKVFDKVYATDVIHRSLRPNPSPVVDTRTFRDEETGSELDITIHEDGSLTVIAERLKR